jgi:predicted nucleic acid-binding protein
MLAIDTNLIVRYLTSDHPKQSAAARALIDGKDVFVCTTVLMETEWVLRSVYGFTADSIEKALTAFGGLPRVTLENPGLAAKALSWMGRGMDFADALHLAAAKGCEAFVSFDRGFAKTASVVGDLKVRVP